MAEPQIFHAGRGEIHKGGIKIATATGIRWSERVSRRRVQFVGDLEASERVVTAIDIDWSIDYVKTTKLDERQQGLVGSRKPADLIKDEPFTIVIKDKAFNPAKVVNTLVDCVYEGGSLSMPAGDICTGSIQGTGKRQLHASEK